jgi:hypothetical protein
MISLDFANEKKRSTSFFRDCRSQRECRTTTGTMPMRALRSLAKQQILSSRNALFPRPVIRQSG